MPPVTVHFPRPIRRQSSDRKPGHTRVGPPGKQLASLLTANNLSILTALPCDSRSRRDRIGIRFVEMSPSSARVSIHAGRKLVAMLRDTPCAASSRSCRASRLVPPLRPGHRLLLNRRKNYGSQRSGLAPQCRGSGTVIFASVDSQSSIVASRMKPIPRL